ncbi:FAD-dependent oxidoreductase [Curtobacterium sp. SL109]|uniref:FAD-dependent oxidoreductase n=1 Tax=Curtobacterium sp. SL109 TaxID=2994662 RepID=UPI0022739E94|nr:FAD-dependent monooxygenase [Curtobacterium sp. SL109]MCY1693717.1 FAD-dependent monooxygenase [Curtobacterium sp. SL109]
MSSPIVIVGAGLAGLTLARVLHIHDIPAIVLESDPTPTARTQGGQLDIHEESGQLAIALAGLSTEFRRLVNDGADSTRVLDSSGHVLFEQGSRGVRPEVLRGDLRTMLLHSLPDDMVRWGAKVTGITKTAGSRWKLQLAGGAEVVSDLIVGADGAWSKVRPLVHDATPTYSGTTFIESYLHDVDVRHPRAAELVGPGA